MRNVKIPFYLSIVTMLVIGACGGSGEVDDEPIDPENTAPTVPSLTSPTPNENCTNYELGFSWSASEDVDGDDISYIIQISQEQGFSIVEFTKTVDVTSASFTLAQGVTYYWRVSATDGTDASDYSTARSFFTEPETGGENTLPSISNLPEAPQRGEVIDASSVILDWEASDGDEGDTLLYDVYFGTDNPPASIHEFGEDLSASILQVSVESGNRYYWRVIAKDSNEGATIGLVWYFDVQ